MTAAVAGGLVGWGINVAFDLDLIRLNVPDVAPENLLEAVGTALLVGAVAGTITSLTGAAIYRARGWQGTPIRRLVVGGVGVAVAATAIAAIADSVRRRRPRQRRGCLGGHDRRCGIHVARRGAPARGRHHGRRRGGWVRRRLRAVPRHRRHRGAGVRPAFGLPSDLAGAAGAAGGIAGGYRLPFTAAALVLGFGAGYTASLTCLATVGVATLAGVGAALTLDRIAASR